MAPFDENTTSDARRHRRYGVREGGIASLLTESDSVLGMILDVSRSGIAFQYIGESSPHAQNEVALEILYGPDGFLLDNVPARVIRDVVTENEFAFSLLPVRRCGLEFNQLTNRQQEQLEFFIENYSS